MEKTRWVNDRICAFDAAFAPAGAAACKSAQACAAFCARSDDSPMVIGTSLFQGFVRWMGIPSSPHLNGPHACGGACRRACAKAKPPTRSSAYTVPGRARDSHPHSPKRPSPFPSRPRRARRNHLCQFSIKFFTTSELGINRTFDREPNRLRDVARWRILRKLPDSLPIIVPKTNGIAVALDRKAKHGRV